jgi:hypothetical protein
MTFLTSAPTTLALFRLRNTTPVKVAVAFAFGALVCACGNDDASDDNVAGGDGGAEATGAETTDNSESEASGIQCAATFTTDSVFDVMVEQDGGTMSVDILGMEGICQQTQLLYPIEGDNDGSCDWLTGLSNVGLFNASFGDSVTVAEGACPADSCVKQCSKQFNSGDRGSITILNQSNFAVSASLYNESDLESFELWCTAVFPQGTLQDCE